MASHEFKFQVWSMVEVVERLLSPDFQGPSIAKNEKKKKRLNKILTWACIMYM
jgi:hypothetical protein